jgi:hypothetical protein
MNTLSGHKIAPGAQKTENADVRENVGVFWRRHQKRNIKMPRGRGIFGFGAEN